MHLPISRIQLNPTFLNPENTAIPSTLPFSRGSSQKFPLFERFSGNSNVFHFCDTSLAEKQRAFSVIFARSRESKRYSRCKRYKNRWFNYVVDAPLKLYAPPTEPLHHPYFSPAIGIVAEDFRNDPIAPIPSGKFENSPTVSVLETRSAQRFSRKSSYFYTCRSFNNSTHRRPAAFDTRSPSFSAFFSASPHVVRFSSRFHAHSL